MSQGPLPTPNSHDIRSFVASEACRCCVYEEKIGEMAVAGQPWKPLTDYCASVTKQAGRLPRAVPVVTPEAHAPAAFRAVASPVNRLLRSLSVTTNANCRSGTP